jgi:YgiT-type zinc finger domain-containing protein
MSYNYGSCHVCGGCIEERLTEQSIRDGDDWVLIRSVPTGVCTKCGEQVFRWHVTERLEQITAQRKNATPAECIEVPIFPF